LEEEWIAGHHTTPHLTNREIRSPSSPANPVRTHVQGTYLRRESERRSTKRDLECRRLLPMPRSSATTHGVRERERERERESHTRGKNVQAAPFRQEPRQCTKLASEGRLGGVCKIKSETHLPSVFKGTEGRADLVHWVRVRVRVRVRVTHLPSVFNVTDGRADLVHWQSKEHLLALQVCHFNPVFRQHQQPSCILGGSPCNVTRSPFCIYTLNHLLCWSASTSDPSQILQRSNQDGDPRAKEAVCERGEVGGGGGGGGGQGTAKTQQTLLPNAYPPPTHTHTLKKNAHLNHELMP
jgi:hypothetical protein